MAAEEPQAKKPKLDEPARLRCKREVLEEAKADLKGRAESVTAKMAHISTRLNAFAGNRKKWIKENVLLDPKTAHPRYVISSDRKRVEWGDVRQEFRYNPKRFEYARCVLGTKGFYSGKHYWAVDVGDGDYWAVGVADESVDRDCELKFVPDEGVWAIACYGDQYKALTSPPTILELDYKPREIRISLNCDAGTVTFYDAKYLTFLCKFQSVDFEGKVFPFFRIADSFNSLKLCP